MATPAAVPRLSVLEGWRGWLAWWVVLAHTLHISGFRRGDIRAYVAEHQNGGAGGEIWNNILLLAVDGKIAITVFVMLSGFVITGLITQKQESYRLYIFRRFMRLWPMLMTALLVYAAFWFIGKSLVPAEQFWAYWLAEVTMLHGLIPNEVLYDGASGITGSGWSISLEWQFYLVAPFIIGAVLKGGWRAALLVGLLVAALIVGLLHGQSADLFGETWTWRQPAALPHLLGFFGLGMGSYALYRGVSLNPHTKRVSVMSLLAIGILALGFTGPIGTGAPLMIWALIMAMIVSAGTPAHGFFEGRISQTLGRVSYSTYIMHVFGS